VAQASDRDILTGAQKNDIHSVKVLGEGAFGIVDLVVVDAGPRALLCVRKKLLKHSDINNGDPAVEVEVLDVCSGCEFVMQMWSHVVGLYDYTLLLEYCPYGTLQGLLTVVSDVRSKSGSACLDWLKDAVLKTNRRAGLAEHEARFYMACSVLGLQSMHQRGVLHRDIKPSNMLIAHNRYLKLADLGLAKRLGEEGRAYTHAGTPGYMAPEVYHSQGKQSGGYSYPADVWSLGIMLWEMVDGAVPKWAVVSWYFTKLHFPDHFSKELRDLLTALLDKAPKDRIKLEEVKAHPWFSGLDWRALEAQKLVAPNMPELAEVHIHTGVRAHSTTNASSRR